MTDIEHDLPAIFDWDDAYANAAHIPNSDAYLQRWASQSKQFRDAQQAIGRPMASAAYGTHERQRIDIFSPSGKPAGLAIFVHGGYWLRFSQRDWSHLAHGAVQHQHITALIGYPLCPENSIAEITASIASAVNMLAKQYPELPLYLAGHSAGGHLVSHLVCKPETLNKGVAERIKRVLSISGVHDLVPLLKTQMNQQFSMTLDDAKALSPARLPPQLPCQVIAWAGTAERPEFIRQNRMLESTWAPLGWDCQTHLEPARHHFDVIDDLTLPDTPMIKRWLN